MSERAQNQRDLPRHRVLIGLPVGLVELADEAVSAPRLTRVLVQVLHHAQHHVEFRYQVRHAATTPSVHPLVPFQVASERRHLAGC